MNLIVLGLIYDLVGVFILVLVTLFGTWHQKTYREKWTRRYYWHGWCPIFRINPPSGKKEWRIKWTRIILRYECIPPKHQWNLIGFFYILIGFSLQIIGNFK
jgi:hypothetical protein